MVAARPARGAADWTVEDILAGLREREAAMANFRVQSTIKGTLRASGIYRTPPGPDTLVSLDESCVVFADASGRLRNEFNGQSLNLATPEKLFPIKHLDTFDGTRAVMLEGRPDKAGWDSARIVANYYEFHWKKNPKELLNHYGDKPISAMLADGKPQIATTFKWQGLDAVTVETTPVKNNGFGKAQFDVVPDRGFLVVRKATLARFTPEQQEWQEFTHVLCEEAVEVSAGVWAPARSVYESFETTKTKPPTVTKDVSWRYEFKNQWTFDPEVDETTFSAKIPGGLFVVDTITDKTYQSVDVSDQDVADQVSAGKSLQEVVGGEAESSNGRLWVALAAGAAALLLVADLVRRARKRRQ